MRVKGANPLSITRVLVAVGMGVLAGGLLALLVILAVWGRAG